VAERGTAIALRSLLKMTLLRKQLAVVLFLTVGALPAAAQTVPGQPDATDHATSGEPAERASWYGYQTLAADAAAVAMGVIAGETRSSGLAMGAVSAYAVGGPAVHALHHRRLAVLGSLGMRIFLPVLVSEAGAATADCSPRVVNDEDCAFGERMLGFAIGIAAAMVIDDAVIAWEWKPVPASDRPAARAPSPSAGLTAMSAVPTRDGGATLVLTGLF